LAIAAAVIGTIFIDCKGFAEYNYQAQSRNLGRVQFVHGGVGRNVAENLAMLNVPCRFISTVDETGIGNEVIARLAKSGVQTDDVRQTTAKGMGMWLAILDEHGNLTGSISQMPELQHLEQLIVEKMETIVQQATHIILEMDLSERISQHVVLLAQKYNKPVYGIPGNLEIVMKHPYLLDRLECFICNDNEAEKLLRRRINKRAIEDLLVRLRQFVDMRKMRSMIITLGEDGAVYYDSETQSIGYQPVNQVTVVDTSGAGDAFFSGTVMGFMHGYKIEHAVQCGTKVAGWTIASAESTCRDLRQKMRSDPLFTA